MIKPKEEILKDKIQACTHITQMFPLWYILHLNYNYSLERKKKYSSLTVNFKYRLHAKTYINLQLQFRNKHYHDKWTAHRYVVTSYCLNHLTI